MSRESSNTIQAQAVARAVRLLEAAGARFAVEFQGEAMGNAKLQEVKKSAPRRNLLGRYKYLEVVENAKPGDLICFNADDGDADSLRAVVCNALTKKFGGGNYITSTKDNVLQALVA